MANMRKPYSASAKMTANQLQPTHMTDKQATCNTTKGSTRNQSTRFSVVAAASRATPALLSSQSTNRLIKLFLINCFIPALPHFYTYLRVKPDASAIE